MILRILIVLVLFDYQLGPGRKCWTQVVAVAKSCITTDQAVKEFTGLLNLGRELCDTLNEEGCVSKASDVLMQIGKGINFIDVAANLPDEHKQAQGAMYKLLDELKDTCNEAFPVDLLDSLGKWLDEQWKVESNPDLGNPSYALQNFDVLQTLMPKLEIRGPAFWKSTCQVEELRHVKTSVWALQCSCCKYGIYSTTLCKMYGFLKVHMSQPRRSV